MAGAGPGGQHLMNPFLGMQNMAPSAGLQDWQRPMAGLGAAPPVGLSQLGLGMPGGPSLLGATGGINPPASAFGGSPAFNGQYMEMSGMQGGMGSAGLPLLGQVGASPMFQLPPAVGAPGSASALLAAALQGPKGQAVAAALQKIQQTQASAQPLAAGQVAPGVDANALAGFMSTESAQYQPPPPQLQPAPGAQYATPVLSAHPQLPRSDVAATLAQLSGGAAAAPASASVETASSNAVDGAASGGASGSTSDGTAAAAAPPEQEEKEVSRCPLHSKKANKACKFCKAFEAAQKRKEQKKEEMKTAQLEKLKEGASKVVYGKDDKAPLTNLVHFPNQLTERIIRSESFATAVGNSTVPEIKAVLGECETCDTESRSQGSLDLQPSHFICSVHRMLTNGLTEGQLHGFLNSRQHWIRCAGYMYVRLGFHYDRYWELLSDALMDDEEFVPFPGRGADSATIGEYVEALLTKDKYDTLLHKNGEKEWSPFSDKSGCSGLMFPRIPVAERKKINRRMVLYTQFRRRYKMNQEVQERYEDIGVDLEISTADGEWSPASLVGPPSAGLRCQAVRIRTPGGQERDVSLGMVIIPGAPAPGGTDPSDLTKSRGKSTQDLLERYEEQQKSTAVASGKDYCKNTGPQMLRVGGIPFVVSGTAGGSKRKIDDREDNQDDEAARARERRLNQETMDQKAKQAAIESKYCARVAGGGGSRSENDGPERMRLG